MVARHVVHVLRSPTTPEPTPVGAKVWTGAAFADAPVRTWTGAAFADADTVKTWTGAAFV